jgi:hypothetical protein
MNAPAALSGELLLGIRALCLSAQLEKLGEGRSPAGDARHQVDFGPETQRLQLGRNGAKGRQNGLASVAMKAQLQPRQCR